MEKIHILTDSAADIPEAQVEAHGIEITPITVTHEGRTFREYYDITAEEYWKLLETSREIPATAMVTPAQFLDSYRRAAERGCTHILGVLINGNGSGTYQAACMARDMFYDEYGRDMRIELLDSQTYTFIYGHIVVLAAELRDAGDSFEAILSVVKSRLNRVEAFLGVYSLQHLKKSGRISGGAAFVGEALGLKPVSHVYAGAVNVCDKVRGEKALVSGIIKKVSARVVQPEKQTAILLYGDVPDERVDELEKRLFTEIGFMGVTRCPIGPSVITNTGPQAIAVAFYGPPRV
ncbi:MAG: DegV family protein [Eubacteriales bacterium]|nr:DegV family protein [Eubacteriales bacterium]